MPDKQYHPIVADLLACLDEQQFEQFQERAAIMEFDAGLDRHLAEALALLDLIRLNPLALAGITALQVELDGATEWLLTTDLTLARQHLADIGAKEITVVNLADVVAQQYGGIATLTTLG
jgi:phospholipase/lecithinase/hemolysin